MATIVTAFITNINNIEFRSYEKYIELGKKMLQQPVPKICYIEKYIYDKYFSSELPMYPQTIFKMFEKEDMYLYEHEYLLSDFSVNTDNPTKDTVGYMFTQCHKTEWIKMAIEDNPFKTTDFIWVDFGIFHMIKDDSKFAFELKKMSKKKYDTVRIASCVNPDEICPMDIISKKVQWFFAGSVFGGNSNMLLEFSRKMKEFTINFMKEHKHIMWEINIWYLLYHTNKNMFNPYHSNHNISILENY